MKCGKEQNNRIVCSPNHGGKYCQGKNHSAEDLGLTAPPASRLRASPALCRDDSGTPLGDRPGLSLPELARAGRVPALPAPTQEQEPVRPLQITLLFAEHAVDAPAHFPRLPLGFALLRPQLVGSPAESARDAGSSRAGAAESPGHS